MKLFPDHLLDRLIANGHLNAVPRQRGAPLDLRPVIKLRTCDQSQSWVYSEAIFQPGLGDIFLYGITKTSRARPEITVSSLFSLETAYLRGCLIHFDADWHPTGSLSQYWQVTELAGDIVDPNQ